MYNNFADNSWDWFIRVTALSIFIFFSLFLVGFFIFSWYLVLITFFFSLLFAAISGTYLTNGLRQNIHAPLLALLSALSGILLASIFIFTKAFN